MKGVAIELCSILRMLLCLQLLGATTGAASDGSPWYDYSAYTECQPHPERPLYNGGILQIQKVETLAQSKYEKMETGAFSPAFVLTNLTQGTRYSFSCWVKLKGSGSALVTARLALDGTTLSCIGNVQAKSRCWSFLKGGFVLDYSSKTSVLYFQSAGDSSLQITVASASLQPFTVEQWAMHQQDSIRMKRKRNVVVHVSDAQGNKLSNVSILVNQLSKDFPFGSAIAATIIGNSAYQAWFVERFNAAVFENELKWYATEPEPGHFNFTLADEMLDFVHANQITARGHNIFWEDPKYTPAWVKNLTGDELRNAVDSRIQSLISRYKGDFVHWDVNNELLHYDFYEQRLGPNASLHFFDTVEKSDPLANVFLNDYNVVETCVDVNSTVDAYISRLKYLKAGGVRMAGIGLEGHFSKPNIPYMRAVLDKLATIGLPIWLTEIDISSYYDQQTQATYLEDVLREGFSYPSVNGILLWSALHPRGCYQMCLTDDNFRNLPAGDVVDRLLQEWQTKETGGVTDALGSYTFDAFLGEYTLSAQYGNRSIQTTVSLSQGDETKHFNIQL